MTPRPSGPHLAQRLRTLALTLPAETSLFYAYNYRALFPPTELEHDSVHVLALCLLEVGNTYGALHLVREFADADADPSHDIPDYENGIPARKPGCYGCAAIVGKCCAKLGRYSEGQAVLDRAIRRSVPTTLPTHTAVETAATASLLAATLSHKGKAPNQAVEYYTKALTDDPWLWEAFTGLCDIGAAPPADAVFQDPPSMLRTSSSNRASRQTTLSPGPMPRSSASEVPNFLTRRQQSPLSSGATPGSSLFTPDQGAGAVPSRVHMMGNMAAWDTPSSAVGDNTFSAIAETTNGGRSARVPNLIQQFIPSLRSTPAMTHEPAKAPPAVKRPRGGQGSRLADTPVSGPLAIETRLNRDLRSMEINGGDKVDPPPRRSSRLNTATKPTSRVTTREKRSTRSQSVTSSTSGATEVSPASAEAQTAAAVDDWLRDIVRRCARAYRALSLFQCREALSEVDALPRELQSSPWVLRLMAKAFFHMSEYKKAVRVFRKVTAVEPYSLALMDLYSTALWLTGDSVELSKLSQNLMAVDREAVQAWIATGNTFSLLGDHEQASRCFRRAAHVAPDSSMAWAMCGHEAVTLDEFERGIAFYRTAIRTNARDHVAWYGLGIVYARLGKWRHAEHHFRRACEINTSSGPLLAAVGEALEQSGNLVGALAELDRASALEHDKDKMTTRYKRARVLVGLGRLVEAVKELEPVARAASEEPDVHLLLGKCYLKTGRNADAVASLTTAREIDPKLEGAVRLILRQGGVDVDGDDEM